MNFDFIPSSTQTMLSQIFWTVGWIPLAAILLWGAKEIWLVYIRTQWAKTVNFIVLAIDIPRNNAQSPKAVENLLSYLAGAHFVPSVIKNTGSEFFNFPSAWKLSVLTVISSF